MKLKHMYKQLSLLAFIAIGSIGSLMAQSRFYQAYSQKVYSIEADIYTNADETGLLGTTSIRLWNRNFR
mgnify:CR=1 FL=1